jgi:hypothetical protein
MINKNLKLYIRKLINEELDDSLMDKTIKNPETGRDIKIRTALSYDEKSKVHQSAKAFLNKSKKDGSKDESGKPKSKIAQALSNTASKAKKGIYNAIGKTSEKVGQTMQKIAYFGSDTMNSKKAKTILTVAGLVGAAAGAVLATTTPMGKEIGQKIFMFGKHGIDRLIETKMADSFTTVKTIQAMSGLAGVGVIAGQVVATANMAIFGLPGAALEDFGKKMRDKADKVNISDSYNRSLNEESQNDTKKMNVLLTNHITDVRDEDIELMKDLVKKGIIDETGELDESKLEQYYNDSLEQLNKQNESKRILKSYIDNKIKSYLSESKTSKKYTIYKATNKKNGKCYIGQTSMDYDLRLERHRIRSKNGEGNKFHKALKYFGFDNFTWRKMFETNSKKECDEKEAEYIKKYKCVEDGYNSTVGRKIIKEKD